jgi:hypothetical protein
MIKSTDSFDARVPVPMGIVALPRVRFAAIRLVEVRPFRPGGGVR